MKKLLTVVLCLAMVLSMTACGSDEPAEATYPDGTINVVVPFAAGGGQHVLATAISSAVDATMVVTNVTGGGGSTGAMEVLHSNADGYTVLCSTLQNIAAGAYNGTYQEADAWEKFVPAATVAGDRMMMIASKASGFTSLEDIVEYSKANPGKLTVTGATANSYTQLVIEKFMADLGVEWEFVPFDGENACRNACMGGQVDLCIFGTAASSTAIDSGDCVGICMLSAERSSYYPEIPTVAEIMDGFDAYDFTIYRCYMLPPETDTAVADTLGGIIEAAMANEEFIASCESMFLEVGYMNREKTTEVITNVYNECGEMYK